MLKYQSSVTCSSHEEDFFKFANFPPFLPLVVTCPLHMNNLNPLHPRMLHPKIWSNWSSHSWEVKNVKS